MCGRSTATIVITNIARLDHKRLTVQLMCWPNMSCILFMFTGLGLVVTIVAAQTWITQVQLVLTTLQCFNNVCK
jgi:hypothetical protein